MFQTVDCPVCGYPLREPVSDATTTKCLDCGTTLQASPTGITQGVTIPTGLFIGITALVAGIIIGPAVMAGTEAGQRRLAEYTRQRVSGR